MNKSLVITDNVKIDRLIPGGQAVATLANGKKALLWNALPGEIVTEIEVTKSKSHYLEGIARKVVQASAFRIAPQDDCYLATSPWQILDYQSELQQKIELLREIFRQQDISTPYLANLELKTDHRALHYRNKMEYSLYFDHASAQIFPSFHARGSHRKIPVKKSSLEHPVLWQAAQDIIAELNAQHADARQYQSLLLRCNQAGHVSGGLYENHRPHPVFAQLTDQILGQTYSYSPNGFFQINLPVYELALRDIANWVKTASVLDLYAGVGTIGLSVARNHNLTLVECDKAAFREMEHNCQKVMEESTLLGSKIQPILAKSEEALDYIQPDQTVIVDPPRAGCRPEVIERLLQTEPTQIIYLSCNPVTQARDVKLLLEKYSIAHLQPFNFFPRTPHIENLVVLTHKN